MDRRRREALIATGLKGEKFTTDQVENYVAYNELTLAGFRRDRYLLANLPFAAAMHTINGIDLPDPAKVPAVQYDDIYDQFKADFDKMDGLADKVALGEAEEETDGVALSDSDGVADSDTLGLADLVALGETLGVLDGVADADNDADVTPSLYT